MLDAIQNFLASYGALLAKGTLDTLIMVVISTLLAYCIGLPLAIIFKLTDPGSLKPQPVVHAILGWVVNMGRSIPYILLMIILIPVSHAITGTSLGVKGAIVPLAIAAAPFVTRIVEGSFSELPFGRVEAALAFGASTLQVVWKVYLKESLPALVRGAAITIITLVGYSAISGALGAGGIGDVAIRYGYYRYQNSVMIATLVILIIIVQIIQSCFDLVARRIDKR